MPLAPGSSGRWTRVAGVAGCPCRKHCIHAEIQIGHPKAERAVGGACAANNIAVAIPCHRLSETTGRSQVVPGVVDRKRQLLEHAKELSGGDPAIPEWANAHVKDNGGLFVKGRLDDFGLGAHVQHLMKTRRVKQFSFSYLSA